MNAINAPGVVYKAVSVAPDMSARELIQQYALLLLPFTGESCNLCRLDPRHSARAAIKGGLLFFLGGGKPM